MARRQLTPEEKARSGRNIALGLGLAAFVIIVFIVTIVRLGGNVIERSF